MLDDTEEHQSEKTGADLKCAFSATGPCALLLPLKCLGMAYTTSNKSQEQSLLLKHAFELSDAASNWYAGVDVAVCTLEKANMIINRHVITP